MAFKLTDSLNFVNPKEGLFLFILIGIFGNSSSFIFGDDNALLLKKFV